MYYYFQQVIILPIFGAMNYVYQSKHKIKDELRNKNVIF